MKAVDLKTKTLKELNSELTNLKKEAMNLRFQRVTGELKNSSRVKVVRRSIARVNTLINEKNRKGEK